MPSGSVVCSCSASSCTTCCFFWRACCCCCSIGCCIGILRGWNWCRRWCVSELQQFLERGQRTFFKLLQLSFCGVNPRRCNAHVVRALLSCCHPCLMLGLCLLLHRACSLLRGFGRLFRGQGLIIFAVGCLHFSGKLLLARLAIC